MPGLHYCVGPAALPRLWDDGPVVWSRMVRWCGPEMLELRRTKRADAPEGAPTQFVNALEGVIEAWAVQVGDYPKTSDVPRGACRPLRETAPASLALAQ